MRHYIEDSLSVSTSNESALKKSFEKMKTAMGRVNMDPFHNAGTIVTKPEYMQILTESIKIPVGTDKFANNVLAEDATRLNALYDNVAVSLMNEAVSNVADISPIAINSFGIQERALIGTHLPRAVKQVTAKVDNFKLTERIPYIIDLKGNRTKFIDAFAANEDGASPALSLRDTVMMGFDVPSMDIDLFAGSSDEVDVAADNYRPAVASGNVFGLDSAVDSIVIKAPESGYTFTKTSDGGSSDSKDAKVTFDVGSVRTPSAEDGVFRLIARWPEYDSSDIAVTRTAVIHGQFNFSEGKLVSITTSNANVTVVKFKMVLSPETHINALTVGYDVKHTPVNIPIGEHFEYSISEEFKDASDKYYNTDAMALLTDYMGRAVEQVKDVVTLGKFKELAENAVVKTVFNCTPADSFSQGREEYIRREFAPFIEKVCIILKNKVRIPGCHFRVVGNPLDIRIAASAGTEYIYKRNEQFAGEVAIDYEFSVSSGVHKIFYLSSERVPMGKIMIFLIPNTIENNISTVNHYEYATYVSNKYKGTKSNLPTVMISTRYLTKEYYPVVATIEVLNNLLADDAVTTRSGTGLAESVYKKVSYVNG